MGNPGRPSSAETETVVVRHMDTGDTIAWSDGYFASRSQPLKELARHLYSAEAEVSLGAHLHRIKHNAQGAALAMIAACKGRGRIVSTDYGVLPADTRIV